MWRKTGYTVLEINRIGGSDMDHYPEELQDQSASPCYDYYTTGGRCRPAPEKKTRNYGWLAAVMGMLLLCMVAWMSLDSEEKPEPAAVPASLAESELTAARLLPDATAEETQPSVKDPGSDAHMAVKSLRAGELTLPQIYEKLIPSVVSISSAAKTAVTALQRAGIINGMGDGTFAPDATLTRAQISKIIWCMRGLG